MEQIFTQFGLGGLMIGIMYFIISKYFIPAIREKDKIIEAMHKDFLTAITNHMAHEEIAFRDLSNNIKTLIKRKNPRRRKSR